MLELEAKCARILVAAFKQGNQVLAIQIVKRDLFHTNPLWVMRSCLARGTALNRWHVIVECECAYPPTRLIHAQATLFLLGYYCLYEETDCDSCRRGGA